MLLYRNDESIMAMAKRPSNTSQTKTVLVTAFGPYDRWSENSSWLCLVELIRDLPGESQVTTRRYPVDLHDARQMLADDLQTGYDYALHLGQSPGSSGVRLEAVGLNVFGGPGDSPSSHEPLENSGPLAYQSALPLDEWAAGLRDEGIPAEVSFHAGTYLCNAMLYWSHFLAEQDSLRTKSCFVHLPLTPQQVAATAEPIATMPSSMTAAAVRWMLGQMH